MREGSNRGEVLLEFYQIGNSVKVSAVDPATMVEVSIIGPASAPRKQLEQTAIAKLEYALAKRAERGGGS